MCKEKVSRYFKCMGCVTLLFVTIAIVGLIIFVVWQFTNNAGVWPIIGTFLSMVGVCVIGSGLANLFFSHSYQILLDHNN